MKRTLSLLFIILFLGGLLEHVCAEDELRLSYCRGVVAAEGGLSVPGKGWTSVAAYVPQAMLCGYQDNEIRAIRVGLTGTTNVEKLAVWVRSGLDSADIVADTVDAGMLKKGWNVINLTVPYAISGQERGLYIGYSFKQGGKTNVVSFTDQVVPGASYVLTEGDTAWVDRYMDGAASIEAVVKGSHLPQYDLGITQARLKEMGDGSYEARAEIHNGALNDIEGFDLTATVEETGKSQIRHFDNFVSAGDNTTATFTLSPDMALTEDSHVTLAITNLSGATDDAPQNNAMQAVRTFQRKVVLEEFTTEKCTNCPRVSELMYGVMDQSEYKGKVIAIAHHTGYGTDWLTQQCDKDLTWLFNNNGQTYAPAVMYDRYPYFSSGHTPCENPGSVNEITFYMQDRLNQDAYAKLSVKAHYLSGGDSILVEVSGRRSQMLSPTLERVSIYVTEDSIKSHDQQGTDPQKYFHQHVVRAYNSTWGDVPTWNGYDFSYETRLGISSGWQKQRMHVVAIVNRYDPNNAANCMIDNAESIDMCQVATGISPAEAASTALPAAYYDLKGRKIAKPCKGITIVRMSDGTTRKVLTR